MSRILIMLFTATTLALSLCCAKKPESIPVIFDTQILKDKTPEEIAAVIGDPVYGQNVKDDFLMDFEGPTNWRFNVYESPNIHIEKLEIYFTPPPRRVFGLWIKFRNPLPESEKNALCMLNIKPAGKPYVKHDQPGFRILEFTDGDVKSLKTGYEVNTNFGVMDERRRTGLTVITAIFHTYTF